MSEKKFAEMFSNRLKHYMEINNMSQTELCEALSNKGLNVGLSSVSYWCNGKKVPRMDKIDAICGIFRIKRSDLIEDTPIQIKAEETNGLNDRERFLLKQYNKADEKTRLAVDVLLDMDRFEKEKALEA